MFKWLGLAASFFIGRMNSSNKSGGFNLNIKDISMEVFSGITQKGRRYVSLALVGFGSVILCCAGILIAVLNATAQYDRSGSVLFTSTFGAGFFMTFIAIGLFAWVFMREWPRSHRSVHVNAHIKRDERVPATGMEAAIASLIMDFVREREWKRSGQEPTTDRAERKRSRREERERERERDRERERTASDAANFPH